MNYQSIIHDVETKYQRLQESKRSVMHSEQLYKIAKTDLQSILFELGHEVPDDLRNEILNQVYWNWRELKVDDITNAFGIRRGTLYSLGVIESIQEYPCRTCGKLLKITFHSRTELDGAKNSKECGDCTYERLKEQNQLWDSREQARLVEAHRLQELKRMPYEEYLKSPEWQAKRQQALHYAGFRCQLCNIGNTILDVHHRIYERLGGEHYRDLIVLCRDCHSRHHEKI